MFLYNLIEEKRKENCKKDENKKKKKITQRENSAHP
jgi:hypothetical protein